MGLFQSLGCRCAGHNGCPNLPSWHCPFVGGRARPPSNRPQRLIEGHLKLALWSSGALGRIGGARSPAFELREPRTGKQRYGGFVMECFQRRGRRLMSHPCLKSGPRACRAQTSEGAAGLAPKALNRLRRSGAAQGAQLYIAGAIPRFPGSVTRSLKPWRQAARFCRRARATGDARAANRPAADCQSVGQRPGNSTQTHQAQVQPPRDCLRAAGLPTVV